MSKPPGHGCYIDMVFVLVAVPIELTAFDIVRRVQINQRLFREPFADLGEKSNRIEPVNLDVFSMGGYSLDA